VLTTAPDDVRSIIELRNRGGSLDWATAWLRVTPQRLFSFAERAWRDASPAHERVLNRLLGLPGRRWMGWPGPGQIPAVGIVLAR
jgi:hypothetical protein